MTTALATPLGAAGFVLCVAFAASLATRRPWLSAVLLAAAALTRIAPWIFQATG